MTYEERLQNVTIIGAAGKMGSGIVLLTVVEMANLGLMPENKDKKYTLNALDLSADALKGLVSYVTAQVTKIATKKIDAVRGYYPNITDDAQISEQYVKDVLAVLNPVTDFSAANDSTMIFEAASENPELKVKLFTQIDAANPHKPWYFTNTSSIPIHILNNNANLDGRIVGFHFYNPPAIQKLVEIIACDKTLPEVVEFAKMYAKKLRKIVVPSNDIAAFFGNGHFLRDLLYASSKVEKLQNDYTFAGAIYIMNTISQKYLVRPMGIFQLIDYVGLDVCQFILKVMAENIQGEVLNSPLLDRFIDAGIKGGQNADGTQKDGVLKYDGGRPVAIFDINKKCYVDLNEIKSLGDSVVGQAPEALAKWKEVVGAENKEELLTAHFNGLKAIDSLGAKMAVEYGKKCKEIGLGLVSRGVANNEQDVNTVMQTGFFHAYGPINNYFE